MKLMNVKYVRIKDMLNIHKKEMNITAKKGMVAIETYDNPFTQKAVVLKNGLVNYILSGR
jgi:hypothetical protein